MPRLPAVALLSILPLLAADQRPLNQSDYDGWKHIQNQQLSNDGRYLAYAVFPQQGDGELIVRDLKTGSEFRQPVGELPPPPAPNYAQPQTEDAPPPPPGLGIKFFDDSSAVVLSTFPRHEDTEAAKRAKAKPEDMPKGDLVVIKLPSGEVFRAPSVKNFQVPAQVSGWVAYLQLPAKSADADVVYRMIERRQSRRASKQNRKSAMELQSLAHPAVNLFPLFTLELNLFTGL